MRAICFYSFMVTLFLLGLTNRPYAQEEKDKFGISFEGFVKADYFFDSRQTVSVREGHFLLFPASAKFGPDGKDIHATPNFNMLAIQSRLTGKISGPDFFSMKTSGLIEGAFFGHSDGDINGFRLRHAFIKLSSDNFEILMGQYWHPMFVTSCFPEVYSFNTGAPFQAFSRNPQLRFSTKGNLRLMATLFSQRDFADRGPDGTSSSYMRNSAIPGLNAQMQYQAGAITVGGGVNYKTIRPSMEDASGNKSNHNLSSLAYWGYAKMQAGHTTTKLTATLGDNMSDLLMLGGIASTDNATGYANTRMMSTWVEWIGGSDKIECGLFAGYAMNMGIVKPLSEGGSLYGLGSTIAYTWRLAPRIAWKSGSTKMGAELEYSLAQYGSISAGDKEVVYEGVDPVSNFRILLFGMYSF